jgi:uncharacterized membrane protein
MGTVALLSGAAAFAFRKGSRFHRIAGHVFFVTMLATSASAVYAGIAKPYRPAIVEGMLVFYWVVSAWLTARRKEGQVGLPEHAVLLLGLGTVVAGVMVGFEARSRPNGVLDGIPASFYFVFAALAALSAAFDAKMIVRKGTFGAKRIVRHLCRMSAAWTIAAANLFIGNAQVFPAALRETNVLFLPVLIGAALLLFWFIRVRFTRWRVNARPEPAG